MEKLKTILLVGMVSFSIYLSTQLWLSHPFTESPRQVAAAYLGPEADVITDWRRLVEPAEAYVHVGNGIHRLAADTTVGQIWAGIARVADRVDPAGMGPMSMQQITDLRRGQKGRGGVELPLATAAPLSFWWHVWRTGFDSSSGPEPPVAMGANVERVAVFLDGDTLVFVLRAEGRYTQRRLVLDDLPADDPLWLTAREIEDVVKTAARGEGTHLVPASDAGADLALEPDLLAPLMPAAISRPAIITLRPGQPDIAQLERVLFGHSSFVRTVAGTDFTIRTDGRTSLTLRGDPVYQVEFQRATAQDADVVADGMRGLTALQAAQAYVNDRGGWPQGVYLARLEPLRRRGTVQLGAEPQLTGYRLEFALRANGVPLELPAVVVVEWGPGGITYFRRDFVSLDLETWQNLPGGLAHSLADGLQLTAELPVELLPAEVRHVGAVGLSYLPPPGQDAQEYFLFLTWHLQLQDRWHLWTDANGVRPRAWLRNPAGEMSVYWPDAPDGRGP